MKARCPNDTSHKQFSTVVHVTAYWIVDEHGNWIDNDGSESGELVHGPDRDNLWICVTCGAEAIVDE